MVYFYRIAFLPGWDGNANFVCVGESLSPHSLFCVLVRHSAEVNFFDVLKQL